MKKSYDKDLDNFIPKESLEFEKRFEIACGIKVQIDQLLKDIKSVRRRARGEEMLVFWQKENIRKIYEGLKHCLKAGEN